MGMVVVTGATGFVGSNLVGHLLRTRQTVDLLCLGRDQRKLGDLADEDRGVAVMRADAMDSTFVDSVAGSIGNRPVDCVVHLASHLTSPSDDVDRGLETLRVNALGTVSVWRLVERLLTATDVGGFIQVSSILAYGHPVPAARYRGFSS